MREESLMREKRRRSLLAAGGQNLRQVQPGDSGYRHGISPGRRVILQDEEVLQSGGLGAGEYRFEIHFA